jgi:hypothetical protein
MTDDAGKAALQSQAIYLAQWSTVEETLPEARWTSSPTENAREEHSLCEHAWCALTAVWISDPSRSPISGKACRAGSACLTPILRGIGPQPFSFHHGRVCS